MAAVLHDLVIVSGLLDADEGIGQGLVVMVRHNHARVFQTVHCGVIAKVSACTLCGGLHLVRDVNGGLTHGNSSKEHVPASLAGLGFARKEGLGVSVGGVLVRGGLCEWIIKRKKKRKRRGEGR